jgi:mannose-1-phosphate guanylyltransferase/mannose-6-phosphate isomerase
MTQPAITPIILAGGKGERLWPLSRQNYPKQILPLMGENSLLQDTAERVGDRRYFDSPVVICNDAIRFIIAEQLREAPPSHIIIEPVGRNTAPAIAVAALMLHAENPDRLMLVLPSDHAVMDVAAFHHMVMQGAEAARQHRLVTFGIVPDSAHTGYGYIHRGTAFNEVAFTVESFVEKPDSDTAGRYVASGDYYWNSGMFLMSARSYLEELERFAPEILRHARLSLEHAVTDLQFLRLNEQYFTACPSNSIDYAIMEKTTRAVVLPAQIGWSDLGAWDSVWHIAPKDTQDNVCKGDIVMQGCAGSYLRSEDGRLLACLGLDQMIVVNTRDATLVAPMSQLQDIKQLTQLLKVQERGEIRDHTTSFRPWGSYATLVCQPGFQVKRIIVACGGKLSLQSHSHRSEHWIVVRGIAKVTCGDNAFLLHENESTFIPSGSKHRLENSGEIDLELIEVQVGSYLGEDDIVRYDDAYGR